MVSQTVSAGSSRRKGHCHAVVIRKRTDASIRVLDFMRRKASRSATQPLSTRGSHYLEMQGPNEITDPTPSASSSITSSAKSTASSMFSLAVEANGIGRGFEHRQQTASSAIASSEVPSSATMPSAQRQKAKLARAASREQDYYAVSPTLERAAARAKRRRVEADFRNRVSAQEEEIRLQRESTPPSPAALRRASQQGSSSLLSATRALPERPQSAMKHRSAHVYSSGRASPLIVMSSNDLPSAKSVRRARQWDEEEHAHICDTSSSAEEDNDAAVLGSRKIVAPRSAAKASRTGISLSSDPRIGCADGTRLRHTPSFSSSGEPSPLSTSPERNATGAIEVVRSAAFVLRSRARLPTSDAYACTKEEERSPTPIRRKDLPL